jgi:hypothetical protein
MRNLAENDINNSFRRMMIDDTVDDEARHNDTVLSWCRQSDTALAMTYSSLAYEVPTLNICTFIIVCVFVNFPRNILEIHLKVSHSFQN